jgi:hypothetical protein
VSWFEFVTQMSNAWAWPAVATGAMVLLRKQLKMLAEAFVKRVDDIKRVKAAGVDIELEKQMQNIAAATAAAEGELRSEAPKALNETVPEDIPLPPETADERLTKYQQLALLDPRAAILLPFADLERSIRGRFRQLHPEERPTVGFARIVDVLHRDGKLDSDIAGSLKQMSRIRNQVAHEQAALDVDIANYFLESVGNVLGYLFLSGFFDDGPTAAGQSA